MQKEFGINLPKRSNHAGIVFIRDFLIIIFIKKCIIKVWQIIAILQTVDKVLRETSVSRSIFLCVYEIYSENRKFSLGLCHP